MNYVLTFYFLFNQKKAKSKLAKSRQAINPWDDFPPKAKPLSGGRIKRTHNKLDLPASWPIHYWLDKLDAWTLAYSNLCKADFAPLLSLSICFYYYDIAPNPNPLGCTRNMDLANGELNCTDQMIDSSVDQCDTEIWEPAHVSLHL